MIQAVFFDFDGLILDTEYPHFLSWREVFAAHGCCLALNIWVEHIGKGTHNNPFSPYEMLDTLLGRRLDQDSIRRMRRKHFAELMAGQQILPGVEAVVEFSGRDNAGRITPAYTAVPLCFYLFRQATDLLAGSIACLNSPTVSCSQL